MSMVVIDKGEQIVEQRKTSEETYAFLTSSSVKGPEAFKPRAILSDLVSEDSERSYSDEDSYSSSIRRLQFQDLPL